MKLALCLLIALAAAAARAEEPGPAVEPRAAPPAPETPAAASAPETPAAAPAPETPPAAPAPPKPPAAAATRKETADPSAKSLADVMIAADKIAKIKFNGFVQGRFEFHEDAKAGLKPDGKPAETTQFLVRRARLRTAVEVPLGELVLDIDATAKGVVLKDAEATFVEPWTPLGIRITAGQFKWPFGYEMLASDYANELPEKSRATRALFPGERDRGLRMVAKWQWLRATAALVNGNGVEDAVYVGNDQNEFKDVLARAAADFGWISAGVSGWYGEAVKTTLPAGAPPVYDRFRRLRAGADAQATFQVPALGPLNLRTEFVWSQDTHLGDGLAGGVPDADQDVTALGAYATAVQNFAQQFAAVLRVDQFDPNRAKAGDQIVSLTGGVLWNASDNVKLSAAYEIPINEGVNLPDSAFTAQLQIKF
jgi:hypothetical protein